MKIPPTLRREDGAAAVEFALIAGVLAMLIFGMLQFGLAFFQLQTMRAATREGARLAAVSAPNSDVLALVNSSSLGAIPANANVISISPCPATPDLDDSAIVSINTQDPDLPGNISDIMSVDIPFVPTININTTIHGEFRCES
ncbi:MAG TPA: TadE/TadG family type IV pilus assembly protein [Actinomycetota bacterium]|nr:TadE/TadG family type IV pilus assembly protein [Actinomycetota bacterium]